MNRNLFLKTSILAASSIAILPHLAWSTPEISNDELIGKGSPKLYGDGYNLRKEAHLQFLKLKAAAEADGISIYVVSSYRNFAHQKRIWDRKFKTYTAQGFSVEKTIEKIIAYSTIPGTSRHHWGTDLDIIQSNVKQPSNVLNEKHFNTNGAFCNLKAWMDAHANAFGFYLVYTDHPTRKGFNYEPWHYSYKPLSKPYLETYKKLDIASLLQNENLLGSQSFSKAFIERYTSQNILDINPELL